MHLRFLGKYSNPDDSPTLYATDRDSYVIQGYVVSDPVTVARLDLDQEETAVRIPPILFGFLTHDGLPGQVTTVTAPIAAVTESGDYIVKGQRVTDSTTLAQMRIPAGETCIEVPKTAITALVGG